MTRIVFLGTPAVAAHALNVLLAQANGNYTVVGIVSQPPARTTRRGGESLSPVHARALESNLPILTPETARDQDFLKELHAWKPDLCVTAAYGNILPQAFLAIPRCGTANIHPSLLPKFRGAAPVQRAIESGLTETGVSLLFTIREMDAGPLFNQIRTPIQPDETTPELLTRLFDLGAQELARLIPQIAAGGIATREQDHSAATHARKIRQEEGILDFDLPAKVLHDRVRAFAGWPGTRAFFLVGDEQIELKVLKSRMVEEPSARCDKPALCGNALRIPCGAHTFLDLIDLQPTGKRSMNARDFCNGLNGKSLSVASTTCGSPKTTESGSRQ